jgi:hypothetical protein
MSVKKLMLGYLVAAGRRYEITGMRLRGGCLEICAEQPGPVPEMRNVPVAVFGDDGRGFAQGEGGPGLGLTCQEVKEGQTAVITLRLQMTHCY